MNQTQFTQKSIIGFKELLKETENENQLNNKIKRGIKFNLKIVYSNLFSLLQTGVR